MIDETNTCVQHHILKLYVTVMHHPESRVCVSVTNTAIALFIFHTVSSLFVY